MPTGMPLPASHGGRVGCEREVLPGAEPTRAAAGAGPGVGVVRDFVPAG